MHAARDLGADPAEAEHERGLAAQLDELAAARGRALPRAAGLCRDRAAQPRVSASSIATACSAISGPYSRCALQSSISSRCLSSGIAT
ncbi:MAG: hypothetical protein U1E76_23595 [Planctomycetota bacterium]